MLDNKKRIVVANWKMKLSHQESVDLAGTLTKRYKHKKNLEVIICPSHTALEAVGKKIEDATFKLGAQDIFYHDVGSYTGEVSPMSVRELGCDYVLIGHSERRKLGETDDDVNRKIQAAIKNDLVPIICVGETFEEYQDKKTDLVIIRQVTKALEDLKLKKNQRIILAYEPVWVIGSGQAIDHSVVEDIVKIIMHTALDIDPSLADKFDVIYGGSVDSDNVSDFIMGNLSTGVIVGSESLKADNFIKILENVN